MADDPAIAIRNTHEAWVQAVARRDAHALGELMTPDYQAWPAGHAPIVGRDAAVTAMMQALSTVEIRQSFESLHLQVFGDWALDRGIESFVITPRDGGPGTEHRQRGVVLLRRDGAGRWQYAWGMTSPEPKGGRG